MRARAAMTLIELMVAAAIMAVALSALLGGMATLSQAHQAGKETAMVQQIAQAMAERVQGATWHTLGTTSQPWSWHRREGAASTLPQPLREAAAAAGSPNDDLQSLGILNQPSGLADLRVHLEYYAMSAVVDPTSGAWRPVSSTSWAALRADPAHLLPQDPAVFDLREVEDAVIVRVLLTWTSHGGVPQRHEITVARRK